MTDTSVPTEAPSLFKKRTTKNATIRKRPATPRPADSESSGYTSSEDEEGRQIKRRRKTVGMMVKSGTNKISNKENLEASKFAADRLGHIESINDATKQSNWYDESGKETLNANQLLGTTRAKASVAGKADSEGIYQGAANYQSFIQRNPNAPNRQVGPVKAPTNIRTITVTDFAPDVCKDYKQTGFCGFGDSCKFLHAREDYKQGWELDKDWEIGTKGKKPLVRSKTGSFEDDSEDDDAALEGVPFACIICKEPYKYPILTKCGHYFCENCALQRYKKNPSCAACGAGTGGVFNTAKGLEKLLDRKRNKAKKRRDHTIANGEEVGEKSDDAAEEAQ